MSNIQTSTWLLFKQVHVYLINKFTSIFKTSTRLQLKSIGMLFNATLVFKRLLFKQVHVNYLNKYMYIVKVRTCLLFQQVKVC